jgi:hypothetical protein
MAQRRKTKRALQKSEPDEDEFEDDDELYEDEEPIQRKRSTSESRIKLSRKKQDLLIIIIAIILIGGTLAGYYYYAFVIDTSKDKTEKVETGNLTGELYVINDISHNWGDNSWHIMNIKGNTNFLLKIENTGELQDTYKLTDNNAVGGIKVKFNKNNIDLKPGKSAISVVNVSNSLNNEYRVPNPISIQLKSITANEILDTVKIYLTIDTLNSDEVALKNQKVSAYYSGSFENGTLFDHSLKDPQNTQPLHISLSNDIQMDEFDTNQYATVIPGFKNGIIGMIPGETHVVVIPPELGYPSDQPLGGETLIFEIVLLSNDKDL